MRGFGFISPDDGGARIFVGERELRRSGVPSLYSGDLVEFALRQAVRGPEAVAIVVISEAGQ